MCNFQLTIECRLVLLSYKIEKQKKKWTTWCVWLTTNTANWKCQMVQHSKMHIFSLVRANMMLYAWERMPFASSVLTRQTEWKYSSTVFRFFFSCYFRCCSSCMPILLFRMPFFSPSLRWWNVDIYLIALLLFFLLVWCCIFRGVSLWQWWRPTGRRRMTSESNGECGNDEWKWVLPTSMHSIYDRPYP